MSKNTPLQSVHVRLGASFTDFGGWNMPVRYSSDLAEHHAVRKAAGIFDLCHMGEIELIGPQAADALDHALVGELSAIAVGKAKYSMMVDETGGIVDDLVVYRLSEDQYMVVANASNVETVLATFRSGMEQFDVDVRDARDEWALIAVQGPASVDIVGGLTDVGLAGLKYYAIDPGTLADADVLLARTGYTGEDGFEIYCRPHDAVIVWNALSAAGEPHGLVPTGLACRDTLRLEAGMPLYGHELSLERTPFEAGLGRVVAFNKEANFVGRRALEVRRDARARQQLVGLITDSPRSPRAGYAVIGPNGQTIGEITSGAPSPSLGHPIALAYVNTEFSATGTRLSVDVRGIRADAQVVDLPFYIRPKR